MSLNPNSNNQKGNKIPSVLFDLRSFLFYEAIFLCITLCYLVLVFFSPSSSAITSLGEERANLSAFRTFFRLVLVCFC